MKDEWLVVAVAEVDCGTSCLTGLPFYQPRQVVPVIDRIEHHRLRRHDRFREYREYLNPLNVLHNVFCHHLIFSLLWKRMQ